MSGTQKTMRRTALLFAAMVLALVVFSGVALAVTKSCEADVSCFGTRKADTLNGSESNDFMFGKGRGDTLIGSGGNDLLSGQGGADKLFGGSASDVLLGGPGNDLLSGDEDSDQYYFGDGWGKDSITESTTSQNVVLFDGNPDSDGVPATANLTIKLISGDGPEVKNAGATSTINWEGKAIQHVYSGTGDDNITGNSSGNIISSGIGTGSSGADTVSALGGDDEIRVYDGFGDDVVDCGENPIIFGSDTDTVYYDAGDEVTNCEVHNP